MVRTPSYRLPRTVVPARYVVELAPDLAAATFAGHVRIEVTAHEAVTEIVLNAAELDMTEAQVTDGGGTTREARVVLDEANEQATLHLDEALPPGRASLDIRYTGILNDQLHGFYRSTFVDADGVERVIATTQFESTDARRAFPCWDEPALKATFAVTLVVPDGLTVLSSGAEVASQEVEDGKRRVEFAETMRMSTYVLAWIVGPFVLTDMVDVDGVALRVAAPPGRAHMTAFGIECGAHALRYLSRYFSIPYPSDKLDHVAVPDFAFGAMENLGCVTYRENALLVDPERASQIELMRVAEVIAHETAHMWFGNLVTMKWWNGIWLNEAFATFMELKTTDDFHPEWQVWTAFGAGRAAALATDGLRATRSVEIEVGAPEEAEAMFDVLTYQKGGSVLRMLEQYLGEETFRRGIARYLSRHHHANTETSDLWDALEAESGEPVRAIMDSWIFQGGHPVVDVTRSADGSGVVLAQRRFLYHGESPERWSVPVNLRASVKGEVVEAKVLLDESATVDLGGPVDWVLVNEGGWGFYRVSYSPELLGRLAVADVQTTCAPLERLGLAGDAWASVVNGTRELAAWLDVVRSLADETDPDVWSAVLAPFGLLDRIGGPSGEAVLSNAVRAIVGPAFQRLGWDPAPGESERTAIARGRLIGALGTIGADPAVRAEAAARLARFDSDPIALAPDVVTAAVNVVASSGRGDGAFDAILGRYRSASTPQDRVRYLLALAWMPDAADQRRTLDLALSDEVRTQDGPLLIASVLNGRGAALTWLWIEDHWDDIRHRFPRSLLVRVFEGVVGLADAGVVQRVHAFIASAEIPVEGLRLRQLEERMDINIALATRIGPGLAEALALALP